METTLPAIRRAVSAEKSRILALGRFIHAHPEPGFEELQASRRIAEYLDGLGFKIEMPYGGLQTAFRAHLRSAGRGPAVAVIAEYDALPGLGHGCGHNLIATTAVTAACGMAGCRRRWRGEFEIIGTPAEEMLAGKSVMAAAGAFDHLDACFMTHPASENSPTAASNALKSFTATFRGQAAHAAAAPQAGINALDAAILFFNGINALRQHVPEDARIHGIITKGGTSCNVIPELAEIRVGIRSRDERYLEELEKRVTATCRSAAKAVGAACRIRWDRHWYRAFRLNPALDRLLVETFDEAGISLGAAAGPVGRGSLDMANVSQIVPAAHPFFSIVPPGRRAVELHSRPFLRQAATPYAYRQALKAGTALAAAAARLLTDGATMRIVRRNFASTSTSVRRRPRCL